MSDLLDAHCRFVVNLMADGQVVPLLGAGVNLCGRPADGAWEQGKYLPSGSELASYLAQYFAYPEEGDRDLVRVSQYAAVMGGEDLLYQQLHDLFDADYPPTALHRFLARFPGRLRKAGRAVRYPVIITTNYDDALERAFRDEDEPYDVLVYMATRGEHHGKFVHWPPGEMVPHAIERPNEYLAIPVDLRTGPQQTVIVKLHGAVDRIDSERDSYVITEDDYIEYLTRSDVSNLVPKPLAQKLKRSNFLFLGYSLRDWNLRVILHRIWGEQKLSRTSWAIQLKPEPIEERFWEYRGVKIFEVSLEDYVVGLEQHMRELEEMGVEL